MFEYRSNPEFVESVNLWIVVQYSWDEDQERYVPVNTKTFSGKENAVAYAKKMTPQKMPDYIAA